MEFDLNSQIVLLHEVTQLDAAWIDASGRVVTQVAQHAVPTSLGFSAQDWSTLSSLVASGPDWRACSASTAGSLEYVVVGRAAPEGPILRLGPFLTVPATLERAGRLVAELGLPPIDRASVANLLQALPLVGSHYALALADLAVAFLEGHRPGREVGAFRAQATARKPDLVRPPSILDQQTIERRYRTEAALRHAVATGNLEFYREVVRREGHLMRIEDRVANNPLRSAKNISFVLNSLFRIAAQTGGLHPVHLHQVSERYAVAIEQAKTATEVYQLHDAMAEDYIDQVRRHRREGLSPVTRRLVDHVVLHLHEDLATSRLATRFGLSPSNVANRFRRELGRTLGDFVQEKRVEEACWLLQWSELSMKEVAGVVGIVDPNAFSRIFRERRGTTPTAYRKGFRSSLDAGQLHRPG